jgi:hypothetical protein
MARNLKPAKRPYGPPSFEVLDANAAKAKLKAMGDPKEATTQKMSSLIDEKLNKRKAKTT